jgi:hypothetical protein
MASIDEQILRAAKEVVVKFIEAGRVSPAGFPETFRTVYTTIDQTVRQTNGAEAADNTD